MPCLRGPLSDCYQDWCLVCKIPFIYVPEARYSPDASDSQVKSFRLPNIWQKDLGTVKTFLDFARGFHGQHCYIVGVALQAYDSLDDDQRRHHLRKVLDTLEVAILTKQKLSAGLILSLCLVALSSISWDFDRIACDRCHRARVKCSRGTPCNQCRDSGYECSYSVSNRISRPKGIPDLEALLK